MKLDTVDPDFAEICATAVSNATSRCFQCLARELAGMYPTTLADIGEVLCLKFDSCDWHATELGWSTVLVSAPFPHIVDGDWRYTAPTAAKLVDLAHRHSGRSGNYLHIGSPSTYKVALAGLPRVGHHVLVDRNAFLHDESAVTDFDEVAYADVALLDPPWYVTETISFLSRAARQVRDEGLVLLAQPGALTRPGVAEERPVVLTAAESLGLNHVVTLANFTRYETPHFERVTLERTLGMQVPADWRTGDLLVFERNGSEMGRGISSSDEAPLNDEWHETMLGPVRVKYRTTPDIETFARLTPTGLPSSVSRRDPLRAQIGIWTSGNRVYGCSDPGVLVASTLRLSTLLRSGSLERSATIAALIESGVSRNLADQAAYSIIEDNGTSAVWLSNATFSRLSRNGPRI